MTRFPFSPLRHECRRWLGISLATVHLHKIEVLEIDGLRYLRKTRRFLARSLIHLGNWYLSLCRIPVRSLPNQTWLNWERAIATSLGQEDRFPHHSPQSNPGSCLIIRYLPGRSLWDLLSDHGVSHEDKIVAVRLAFESLQDLHGHSAEWTPGRIQSLSHGDATARNVIVDMKHRTAVWIDFDIRHLTDLPESERRADDLLALAFSVHACSSVDISDSTVQFTATGSLSADARQSLHRRLAEGIFQMNPFQLAQAPLTWSRAKSLRQNLVDALNRETTSGSSARSLSSPKPTASN